MKQLTAAAPKKGARKLKKMEEKAAKDARRAIVPAAATPMSRINSSKCKPHRSGDLMDSAIITAMETQRRRH